MTSPAAPTFPKFFERLLKKYGGSKQDLAKEIGISASSISHLASGEMGPGVELCFRLAAATGVSALAILRAAGKAEVADLVEALFGEAPRGRRLDQGVEYSQGELALLAKLRLVRPRSRRALRALITVAAENGAYQLLHGPSTVKRLLVEQQASRRPRLRLKP